MYDLADEYYWRLIDCLKVAGFELDGTKGREILDIKPRSEALHIGSCLGEAGGSRSIFLSSGVRS